MVKKYIQHCLALNPEEEVQFQEIKKRTGFGVKKIFMAMIDMLKTETIEEG